MKKLIFLLPLFLALSSRATTFTEFYAQTSGSNLNSGSTTNDAANTTYAGGTWVVATLVFTVASGNPTTDPGVTNGAWASVYTTSGATIATCVGLITNTTITTITLDARTLSGAAANPSATAAATTCKVGGAWQGPNAAIGFPFGFIAQTSTNGANIWPRCNFRNNGNYAVSAAMTHSLSGPVRFQGMTSVPGDLGRFIIDGGTAGASYIPLTLSGADIDFVDAILWRNGGASSTGAGMAASGARGFFNRVSVYGMWRDGVSSSGTPQIWEECEFSTNNVSGTAAHGGFNNASTTLMMVRCFFHHNSAANSSGVVSIGSGPTFIHCVFDTNAKDGITISSSVSAEVFGCDFYNNVGSGVDFSLSTIGSLVVENCNFVKNAFGVSSSGSSQRNGLIQNCGFGSGTMTNTSGGIAANIGGIDTQNNITYATDASPWSNAGAGDFRITLAAAKSAGRGSFTESAVGYSGTVAYPDIGVGQNSDTNSAVAGGSYTFSQ